MSARVYCSCGHDAMDHHGTTWRCRSQNSDGSECKCARLVPTNAHFGGEVYRLVPLSADDNPTDTAPPKVKP